MFLNYEVMMGAMLVKSFLLTCQLKTSIIWEEGTSVRKFLHRIGLWASLWVTFLINDLSGNAQTILCGATPGQVKF